MSKGKLLVFLLILMISTMSIVNADVLKLGSKGDEVTAVQLRLKQLGYFTATATGYYGTKTQQAVKLFQANNGFIATGEINTALLQKLFADMKRTSSGESLVLTKEQMKLCQTVLQKAGYYAGKLDGLYGPMTEAAVKKYQQANGLAVNGRIDEATYALMNGISQNNESTQTPSRGGTVEKPKEDISSTQLGEGTEVQATESIRENVELLDWFTEAGSVFYIGATANVVDVRTGKSFKIVRTYGHNHADCEALTKEDSAVIKEIWGGDWSWNRRPVIIEVDGRRIAASIAAMPHAGLDSKAAGTYVNGRSGGYGYGYNYDKIKDNEMDGHIDVHFLNSRTHGTNVVNAAHQNAVLEAAGK